MTAKSATMAAAGGYYATNPDNDAASILLRAQKKIIFDKYPQAAEAKPAPTGQIPGAAVSVSATLNSKSIKHARLGAGSVEQNPVSGCGRLR